ncbi:MAG: RNA polymerase sigma-70 factor [Salinivirgaceae bacterium]|nr:RNA polymerase sigma-70 factor [Salinivirgaceae bacterium]
MNKINISNVTHKESFDEKYEDVFYQLYSPLCIYCLKIVDDSEVAKDIVQDQFANLWENWDRHSKLDALQAYLYAAVKNRALNYLKKHAVKNNINNLDIVSNNSMEPKSDPHHILENLELEQILESALNKLPNKCKEIFLLKRFAELSNKEIADKLDISVKTVENQMTIALKRIREYVKKNWSALVLLLNYFIQ